MVVKNVFILLLLACLLANATATTDLPIKPGYEVVSTFQVNGDQANCLKLLANMRSCSNGIAGFLLKTQNNLNPECVMPFPPSPIIAWLPRSNHLVSPQRYTPHFKAIVTLLLVLLQLLLLARILLLLIRWWWIRNGLIERLLVGPSIFFRPNKICNFVFFMWKLVICFCVSQSWCFLVYCVIFIYRNKGNYNWSRFLHDRMMIAMKFKECYH